MASKGGQQANEEDELILSLREEKGWAFPYLYLFQEFWCPSTLIQQINIFRKYFQPKDSDVVVASFPKSGTTWLKALTFAIVNHQRFSSIENHPLLTSNPHELVPPLYMFHAAPQDPKQQLHLLSQHEHLQAITPGTYTSRNSAPTSSSDAL
ncbi:Cytosolic sulfotransferase 15 [Spatholobus suberectus]|nr:Cytosolic sulfotransferase 15 [Spatholobus suberectus]